VQSGSSGDIASIYQELQSAEQTADVLEGRLSTLERRLDELLEKLEAQNEVSASRGKLQ
jgi:predicted nuclease with TOPRIM domain